MGPAATLAYATECGGNTTVTYTGPSRRLHGQQFTAHRCSCAGYLHAARISYEIRDTHGALIELCVDPEFLTPAA